MSSILSYSFKDLLPGRMPCWQSRWSENDCTFWRDQAETRQRSFMEQLMTNTMTIHGFYGKPASSYSLWIHSETLIRVNGNHLDSYTHFTCWSIFPQKHTWLWIILCHLIFQPWREMPLWKLQKVMPPKIVPYGRRVMYIAARSNGHTVLEFLNYPANCLNCTTCLCFEKGMCSRLWAWLFIGQSWSDQCLSRAHVSQIYVKVLSSKLSKSTNTMALMYLSRIYSIRFNGLQVWYIRLNLYWSMRLPTVLM